MYHYSKRNRKGDKGDMQCQHPTKHLIIVYHYRTVDKITMFYKTLSSFFPNEFIKRLTSSIFEILRSFMALHDYKAFASCNQGHYIELKIEFENGLFD